jgi:hypothetical protein
MKGKQSHLRVPYTPNAKYTYIHMNIYNIIQTMYARMCKDNVLNVHIDDKNGNCVAQTQTHT